MYCARTRVLRCSRFVVRAGLRCQHRRSHGDQHAGHPTAEERRVTRSLHHGAQLRTCQLLVSRAPVRDAVSRTRAGAHHPQSVRGEQDATRQHQSADVIRRGSPSLQQLNAFQCAFAGSFSLCRWHLSRLCVNCVNIFPERTWSPYPIVKYCTVSVHDSL